MNTTCLNSIYCCICIYIYKCRCTKDLAILIAICSIRHGEGCRRHHFTFHVETAFLTIRIRIWLHSTLACGPLSRRSLLYWNRLLNNDMVGHSWCSKSRQDRVLIQENFLYHIIFRNQFYFNFFSMEPQLPAKSNVVFFYSLTYSCYIICARSSYDGGLCMWDGGIY